MVLNVSGRVVEAGVSWQDALRTIQALRWHMALSNSSHSIAMI